jgi:hypothetical protein
VVAWFADAGADHQLDEVGEERVGGVGEAQARSKYLK